MRASTTKFIIPKHACDRQGEMRENILQDGVNREALRPHRRVKMTRMTWGEQWDCRLRDAEAL